MSVPTSRSFQESFMHLLLRAFAPLRGRGMLLDGPAHLPGRRIAPKRSAASPEYLPLGLFVARLRELIETEDETTRLMLEQDLLRLARPLDAAGVFDVIRIAHPAAASMVADHLADRVTRRAGRRA